MRYAAIVTAVCLILVLCGVLCAQDAKHEEMLYPTVRVTVKQTGGSGTVVFCGQDAGGAWETYVITNHHVIAGAVSVKEEWDPQVGEIVKKERRQVCAVEFFLYNADDTPAGANKLDAEVCAYDATQDWALLKLKATFKPQGVRVAHLFPKGKEGEIRMYDEVYAVGAQLGHAPIATVGIISHKGDLIDHYDYWMSTAQIIYGSSGGAVYRFSPARKRYEYIGIPSRIAISGWSDAVTHMGYFVPIPRIYALLRSHCYDFIYDSSRTIEQCAAERKAMRERARERFIKRRGKVEKKDGE